MKQHTNLLVPAAKRCRDANMRTRTHKPVCTCLLKLYCIQVVQAGLDLFISKTEGCTEESLSKALAEPAYAEFAGLLLMKYDYEHFVATMRSRRFGRSPKPTHPINSPRCQGAHPLPFTCATTKTEVPAKNIRWNTGRSGAKRPVAEVTRFSGGRGLGLNCPAHVRGNAILYNCC